MAYVHGKSTVVYLSEYDITSYCDSAEPGQSMEPADTTCFGNASHTFIAGLKDGTVGLSGSADFSTGAIDAVLNAAISGGQKYLTIGFGGDTIGNRCRLATIRETNYSISIPVGDKVSWAADLQADGGIDGNGVFLHAKGAETGTVNSASVNNGAASTNGWAAILHVFDVDVTSATIKIQHSTDDASWSDLATFTNVTGTTDTSELKTGTGTVNQYVRVIISSFTGTTITYAVSFARR